MLNHYNRLVPPVGVLVICPLQWPASILGFAQKEGIDSLQTYS